MNGTSRGLLVGRFSYSRGAFQPHHKDFCKHGDHAFLSQSNTRMSGAYTLFRILMCDPQHIVACLLG